MGLFVQAAAVRTTEAAPSKSGTRFVLQKQLAGIPSQPPPPLLWQLEVQAGPGPSPPGRSCGKVDEPLETDHRRDAPPRCPLNCRARRAPAARSALCQGHPRRGREGGRNVESHVQLEVGWPGAIEAPSHGRSGTTPCVAVALETMVARLWEWGRHSPLAARFTVRDEPIVKLANPRRDRLPRS